MATCTAINNPEVCFEDVCDGHCWGCYYNNDTAEFDEYTKQQQQQKLQSTIDAEAFAKQELELLADCIS